MTLEQWITFKKYYYIDLKIIKVQKYFKNPMWRGHWILLYPQPHYSFP